jgi:hypothetical protein
MRWVEYVAHMVGKKNICKILSDNLKRKIIWEMECLLPKQCLGVEGWIHLVWDRGQ